MILRFLSKLTGFWIQIFSNRNWRRENFLNNGDTFSYTEDSILLQELLDNIIKLGESKKL